MQPDLFSPAFGYEQVDGVGRARQRAIEPRLSGQVRADAIGPMIEFGNLVEAGGSQALRSATWFDEGPRRPFLRALMGAADRWIHSNGGCGFVRGGMLAGDKALNGFKIDAHRAAHAAGFGTAAPLLVAAMGELIGNVEDHSEAAHSGLCTFLSRDGVFEFVVADRGIGVLGSLRKSADYTALADEGAALLKMIESGVSRFGRDKGHGNGFRPIFERLADMTGQLRFRSGDHALSLDGRFGDRIGRQLSQKPRIAGFFAAVVCRAPRQR